MATISINLAMDLTPSPKQNALAEAISKAMIADEQIQIALQDLDLKPTAQDYHSAATAAVMALFALQIEALKSGAK
jgi:hypothetical protein